MKLTLAERIALLSIMPPEGDITTLRILRELQNNLSFSEKELKEYKIKNNTGQGRMFITWDADFNDVTTDIAIGETAIGIVTEQLKKLSDGKKLRMEMLTLYEKFVDGKK